ncbi:MAG: phenylalanine--tRNA ligase subunit beta [Planctomycetota bacterium]|nr:MAG: phenylalanine--tRNA ligase subunit beta [Planctomycetota bacterium]
MCASSHSSEHAVKISYRWLSRHVDLAGLAPQDVANDLTLHTAEVEGLHAFAPVLERVVVGHVLERAKHPDADKLSVCRVDVGTAGGATEPLQIVCGAPNVAGGQRVAVALAGTELPGDVKIKKSKIRGVESNGMICSERELGLGDEHNGIWVLPEGAHVGKAVLASTELLGAPGVASALDWVIEIDNKSLTHRPDLWGHRGFARELQAIRGAALKPLALDLAALSKRAGAGAPFAVRVDSPACLRYLALELDGVANGRSPDWLRFLLLAVGQRPIDVLVDVSNFVMLDLGQPNHVFDRRNLPKRSIEVRQARASESLTTLDGVARALEPADLLICSGDAPVALAGVMGGDACKVAPDTASILLEVASFQPAVVRRTAQRLALRTDASARFEKNLAPTLAGEAVAHFANVLAELQPGVRIASPLADAGQWKDPARTLALRPARVRALLGHDVDDARIEQILGRLDLGVTKRTPTEWDVRIPSIRATKDLAIEQDLVEEVGRIIGYGAIPERPLVAPIAPAPRDERRELVRALQDRLSGTHAFHETLSYSFLPQALGDKLGVLGESFVEVVNPVSEGWQRVRRSVATSLLGLLEPNLLHASEIRVYEVGKAYLPERANEHGEPLELHELALVLAQPKPAADARYDAGALQRLKAIVEDALRDAGRPASRWLASSDGAPPWAHPKRCAVAQLERAGSTSIVASLAELNPHTARALGVSADVAVASLWIDALVAAPRTARRYAALPKFPGTLVDVALSVPTARAAAEVEGAIRSAGKDLVRTLRLFDLYEFDSPAGEKAGAGRKSLAYAVELVAEGRTLAEKDTQRFLERLAREAEALGGELRRA